MKFIDKDLASVQEARILLKNSENSKAILREFSQSKLDEMLMKLHENLKKHFDELATLLVQETGYGNVRDEELLLNLLGDRLIEKYKGINCIGSKDNEKLIESQEIRVPLGVVLGIVSEINPLIAAISIMYAALKSGNTLILSTENRATKTLCEFVRIVSEIMETLNYPKDTVSCPKTMTVLGNLELINSDRVSVVVNAGIEKYLDSNKSRYIYGSNGASPVFIDRTADVEKAVSEIIESRSFNYGTLPGVEQFIIVDEKIKDLVKEVAKTKKAYFMNEDEEKKLVSFLFENGEVDKEYIGRSPMWLAKMAGFEIPIDTKVLVSEQKYISDRNHYAKELKIPVLVVYIEKDWINGCERCIELLVDDNVGHTLSIYSNNENVVEQFIITKPVGRILLNTSSAFGGMGITSDITPSAVLGALTCNKGISAKNLSPEDLTYTRSIGRGTGKILNFEKEKTQEINTEKLEKIFLNILKGFSDK